jgi:hypothetical protein
MLILRPRKVRLHQLDPAPTIEGFLVNSWNSHYRLLKPVLLEATGRSIELEGEALVPRERVVFIETVRS